MKHLSFALLSMFMATASYATDVRGIWNAGLQGRSPNSTSISLSWTLEAIGDVGRLTAEGEGWGADYSGPKVACTYFIDFKGGGPLVGEPGIAPICPATGDISLNIVGNDVTLGETPGLEIFGELTLRNLVAYVPEAQLATLPNAFDALGAGPRKTLAEIEDNLIGTRGWTLASSRVTKGGGSDAGRLSRVYLSDDRTVTHPSGHSRVPVDVITIGYESVLDAAQADAPERRAVVVERNTYYFRADQEVAMATMKGALDAKYGVSAFEQNGAGDGNRDFDRQGNLITNRARNNFAPCVLNEQGRRKDVVQLKWNFDRPWTGRSGELWGSSFLGCGAHTGILVREYAGTGAVDEVKVTLMDRDLILNSEWTFIEARLSPEIRTAMGLANAGGSAAPEL